jgi:hypothetical protein
MASQKKISANRRNGRKGQGPRTAAGKMQSRLNARKHGLSIPLMANQALHEDVLKIARTIAGANDALMEPARVIAETELMLQRVQQARLAAISMAINEIDNRNRSVAASQNGPDSHAGGAETTVSEAFVVALPSLQRIERYERRAYSRRAKAVARLNDLRMLSQLSL